MLYKGPFYNQPKKKRNTHLNWKFWNTSLLKVVEIFEMYNCDIMFFHQKLYEKVLETFWGGKSVFFAVGWKHTHTHHNSILPWAGI
jgi:hypothetical protein